MAESLKKRKRKNRKKKKKNKDPSSFFRFVGPAGSSAATVHNGAAGAGAASLDPFNSTVAQSVGQTSGDADPQIGALRGQVDARGRDAGGGVAVAGLPQPSALGKSVAAIAGCAFQGQQATAVGLGRL